MNEVIIDANNFNEYFFDVRQHTPQRGQIMVRYSAIAEFVAGPEKQQMIDLLCLPGKALPATQVMRKLLFANEADSIRVPKEIIEDLRNGTSIDKILKKPYKYTLECFYYTHPEYVPNDPHWTSISLIHLDDFLKAKEKNENCEKTK